MKLLTLFLTLIFLYSCGTAKDALMGKKRSEQGDEFLIDKKNPLTMPPDFEKLPIPGESENILFNENKEEDTEIKYLLNIKDENNSENKKLNSDLESFVIEKIK